MVKVQPRLSFSDTAGVNVAEPSGEREKEGWHGSLVLYMYLFRYLFNIIETKKQSPNTGARANNTLHK